MAVEAAVIARLATLELKARVVVEGFLSGMHRSPFKGASVEFAQHRTYVPGDDLKHLDWKVWGRNGRYMIKEYEAETNLVAHLVLDGSASMSYRGSRAWAGCSKLDYGRIAVAAIAHLAVGQSDCAGIAMLGSGLDIHVPRAGSRAKLAAAMARLEAWKPPQRADVAQALTAFAGRIRSRGLVVVCSDLLDDHPAAIAGLQQLRHAGHEVVLIHLLDRDELDFALDGAVRFEGLESSEHLDCHPRALRAGYLAELERWLTAVEAGCRAAGILYERIDTATPADVALTALMHRREHLGPLLAGGSRR